MNGPTPYPILNFVIWLIVVIVAVVLIVAVLIWAVNKFEADAADAALVTLASVRRLGDGCCPRCP